MSIRIVPVIHPGEILREEYLAPLSMSAGMLAKQLHVPRTRIERIVTEQTPITTNTALRLAKFFNTTPEFWLSMQTAFDLASEAKEIADELGTISTFQAA